MPDAPRPMRLWREKLLIGSGPRSACVREYRYFLADPNEDNRRMIFSIDPNYVSVQQIRWILEILGAEVVQKSGDLRQQDLKVKTSLIGDQTREMREAEGGTRWNGSHSG